jgi:hypothetical protein
MLGLFLSIFLIVFGIKFMLLLYVMYFAIIWLTAVSQNNFKVGSGGSSCVYAVLWLWYGLPGVF